MKSNVFLQKGFNFCYIRITYTYSTDGFLIQQITIISSFEKF